LIGYRPSGSDGLYEFADVPLLYGVNVFRLEFHGPQAQSRSETRWVNLGRALTPPGRTDYRLIAHRTVSRTERLRAEVSTGLTHALGATGRIASLDLEDGHHLYAGGGLRLGWARAFLKADAMADTAGGSAAQAGVAARLGRRLGMSAQCAWLDR